MATRRNGFVEWVVTTSAISLARITAFLPLSVCRILGRWAGRAAYAFVPRVRKVAIDNITLAYGDALSPSEKRRLALGAAENVGIVGAEFSHIAALTKETVTKWVRVEGIEHLPRDRGALVIGAHLGNWEWMASAFACLGFKVAEIVRPLDDPRMNRYVEGMRESCGVRTIPKDHAGKELLRLLEEGWIVALLVDQSPRTSAVPVTFFGQPCWATIAPALVSARADVPIVTFTMTREKSGSYALIVSPPIETDHSVESKTNFVRVGQQFQDLIEADIRKCPDQWLWLHRRWKKRPRLEQEWADRMARTNVAKSDPPAST
ncbi:MAG: lysophospholipid acyltransferase family protein [Candidatus Hydrogenedentales bacterium]|jgi:KDO2-lipid IV(A) lauroyltransferase